jgi:hypothetical protein
MYKALLRAYKALTLVPLHELGHVLACTFLKVKVLKVNWWKGVKCIPTSPARDAAISLAGPLASAIPFIAMGGLWPFMQLCSGNPELFGEWLVRWQFLGIVSWFSFTASCLAQLIPLPLEGGNDGWHALVAIWHMLKRRRY